MALDLNGVDYTGYAAGGGELSASPCTISAFVYPDVINTTSNIFATDNAAETQNNVILANDGTIGSGGQIVFYRNGTVLKSRRVAGSDPAVLTAGSWQHILATDDGSGNFSAVHIYRNAIEAAAYEREFNGSGEYDSNGIWRTGVLLDGRIAEVAAWNIQLNQSEITALSKGLSPLFIRPQSLVFYTPLIRNDSELINGRVNTFTGGGHAVIQHPRIIYPDFYLGRRWISVGPIVTKSLVFDPTQLTQGKLLIR